MILFLQALAFLSLTLTFSGKTFPVEAIEVEAIEHKFYLSVSKVNYSVEDKALQMVSRVFIDDIELAINQRYGIVLALDTEAEQKSMTQQTISRYLSRMLQLRVNNELVESHLVGYTYEADQILLLVEFKDITFSTTTNMEFQNRLLTDVFEEQQNLVHFTLPNFKKSVVLSRERDSFKWDFSLP
jgi:hypothetical protein